MKQDEVPRATSESPVRDPAAPGEKAGGRFRARWVYGLIAVWVALAFLDLTVFRITPGSQSAAGHTRAAAPIPSATAPSRSSPLASPSVTMRPGAVTRPAAAATHVLVPLSVVAFGPTGAGSGDNPAHAAKSVDASTATDWSTDWYQTAEFGNMQAGTGLLIDMGKRVTISSVELNLGRPQGADLELLTANQPGRAAMAVRASATDVGGRVSLSLHRPGPARYLLIWFTLLPRDSAGTYKATVYNVTIKGVS